MKAMKLFKNVQRYICLPYYVLAFIVTAGMTAASLFMKSKGADMYDCMCIDLILAAITLFFAPSLYNSAVRIASANNVPRYQTALCVIISSLIFSLLSSCLVTVSSAAIYSGSEDFFFYTSGDFLVGLFRYYMWFGSFGKFFASYLIFSTALAMVICALKAVLSACGIKGKMLSFICLAAMILLVFLRMGYVTQESDKSIPIIFICYTLVALAVTAVSVSKNDRYGMK